MSEAQFLSSDSHYFGTVCGIVPYYILLFRPRDCVVLCHDNNDDNNNDDYNNSVVRQQPVQVWVRTAVYSLITPLRLYTRLSRWFRWSGLFRSVTTTFSVYIWRAFFLILLRGYRHGLLAEQVSNFSYFLCCNIIWKSYIFVCSKFILIVSIIFNFFLKKALTTQRRLSLFVL